VRPSKQGREFLPQARELPVDDVMTDEAMTPPGPVAVPPGRISQSDLWDEALDTAFAEVDLMDLIDAEPDEMGWVGPVPAEFQTGDSGVADQGRDRVDDEADEAGS
jgi:hypothetical protein